MPELVSNLEFGGKEGNILYVTATTSLYKMELNQIGANPYAYKLITGIIIFVAMYADALKKDMKTN